MEHEVIIHNSIKEFLEEWYLPKNMKLLHWVYITPQSHMFEFIPSCDCCSGSHYVECLYQTYDGLYIIRRYGFNTQNPENIYLSDDRFIEPIQHPYSGYQEYDNFFYNQYIDNVISPRTSNHSSQNNSNSNSRNNSQPSSRRNSGRLSSSNNSNKIIRKSSNRVFDFFGPKSL